MNSLERVIAAVNFQPSDRPPVIAQLLGHTAVVEGYSIQEYILDGKLVAECQMKALKRYRHDAVFAAMDLTVEAEALGCRLCYHAHDYATIEQYALTEDDSFEHLSLPDPEQAGRMPQILLAVRALRQMTEDQVPVVGFTVGPMTLVSQLLGIEKALFLAIDAPDRFEKLLDFSAQTILHFGLCQLNAGAHLVLVFDPAATPNVVPPSFFRTYELPRLKMLFSAFKKKGSIANWLHIAGPVHKILPLYKEAGTDIANFDYCVSAEEAMAAAPDICLDGNIKPLSFLVGPASEIQERSSMLVKLFQNRGGFILSSGCEIPPASPPEHVHAMTNVVWSG